MRKKPGLAAAILATFALGIGATTAIYTVVYAALIAPFPYPHPEQLTIVWSKVGQSRNVLSAGDFLDWQAENHSFQKLAAWTGASFNLSTREEPEKLDGRLVTPGYFDLQGIPFLFGRDFTAEEGTPGKDHVVILTYKLWNRLGADHSILGHELTIGGAPYTVIGVLAPGVADRLGPELIAPLAFRPDQINHDFHWLLAMGRLKPGVSIQQAQADMDSVARQIGARYPGSNKGWGISVEPLKNDFLPPERIHNLWLLLGAVGFVLLITCANVANLLLARGAARQREVAIRGSIGAGRAHIFSQFLTESLLQAFIGGICGVLLGAGLLRAVLAVIPENILPSEANFHLDIHVLAVALVATTISGILFGCAPAWYASRIDPAASLKDGGARASAGIGSSKVRQALIVAEFALALSLLAGAGLAIHSFWNLTRVDLGIQTDHVLTFSLSQPDQKFKTPAQIENYYRQMLGAGRSVTGIKYAALSSGMPLRYHSNGMPFTVVGGRDYADRSQRPNTGFDAVTPDYFKAFGIQVIKGRTFNNQDTATSPRVAMVSEEMANRYLSGKDPLKQRLLIEQIVPGSPQLGPAVEWQIVGVYHSVRYDGLRDDDPDTLVPFSQSLFPDVNIAVRTSADPGTMARTIAAAVHSVDPQIALGTVRTMDQVKDEVLAEDRFTMVLFASFAALALFLAGIGIYGVMAFAVSQRTHEIGVRIALGASRGNVTALILGQGSALAVVGLGIGLVGAVLVDRTMRSALYEVGNIDYSVLMLIAIVLFTTGLFACYLPARRAAKVDPVQALRNE